MEYNKDGDPDYEAWLRKNKQFIPARYINVLERGIELFQFMTSVYYKLMEELAPALHKLMLEQYPIFKTEKRPQVVEYIDGIVSTAGSPLIWQLRGLLKDQNAGDNVRDKYPQFEEWIECYARPRKPKTIDESTRPQYTWLSDAEWEEYRDSENKILLQFFNWEEKRIFDFIDVVQTLLFKYYKELDELNADELIMFAVFIRDEYEYFKMSCELVESIIDCGLPEEYVNKPYNEFMEGYMAMSKEKSDYVRNLRFRRIAGEII